MAADAIGTNGKIWFDNVELREYDENNNYVRTVMTEDFTASNYGFFAPDYVGSGTCEQTGGVDNSACALISGTIGRSFLVMDKYLLTPGYHYVLTASVRGENVSPGAFAAPYFDLYRILAEDEPGSSRERIRDYLRPNVQFSEENNVPLWMGEFGTTKASCEEDRGGDRWIGDVLELCREENIHYCYYSYHDTWFGLWESDGMQSKANLSAVKQDALAYGNDLNTVNISVTFNANDGSGAARTQTFLRDTRQTLSANAFARSGYLFAGWNTQADGSGTAYADAAAVNLPTNLVLFAQWYRHAQGRVYLPESLTTIGDQAFEQTDFTAIVLGEHTRSIGSRAFADCKNLIEITIPSSVTSIAVDAFAGCPGELVIIGAPGSAAHAYADAHGYRFATMK